MVADVEESLAGCWKTEATDMIREWVHTWRVPSSDTRKDSMSLSSLMESPSTLIDKPEAEPLAKLSLAHSASDVGRPVPPGKKKSRETAEYNQAPLSPTEPAWTPRHPSVTLRETQVHTPPGSANPGSGMLAMRSVACPRTHRRCAAHANPIT
jgi:hypothetical protein